jgi:hypothetical protein
VLDPFGNLRQRLQSKLLRMIGNFPRHALIRKIPCFYYFTIKSCRQEGDGIRNHENETVHNTGKGEAQHKTYAA